MPQSRYDNTWQEDPDDVIILVNRSKKNFILEMPSGRCRLDAGRRIRTLRSILNLTQVRALVEEGELRIE
jgi:hypothetical protein